MDIPSIYPAMITPGQGPRSTLKWLLIIIGVLFLVICIFSVVFVISETQHPGVKVIRMEGTLATGDFTSDDSVGSEYVGNQLRAAADDPTVDAIVLRVDSPGGSPAAAEEIISDLNYAKSKKPVVVSMGDMATSAAYYVSAHANLIYADPDTLTGAVGVIWTFSDISGWMNQEGYNVTVVKSGAFKDMGSTSRALSPAEEAYAQQIVNESFERFIDDVTTQRMISRSDIADGRVIRGADALKINLVDRLGNLNDAIDGAQALADARK
ncbi:signal peptide peptidase SppA [Methanoregula sp.]|uniref:signal peptide peptidase SppA n=1 Tax=Methanoregula sp. TaxID=2052170 RepID=UPI002CBAF394|nr:signal peptide peptidase SppA [Methanoregula sp.]HVP97435.1 signal peptide peptidase SppA [Methanoregula sp.]